MKSKLLIVAFFVAAMSLSGLAEAREFGQIYTDCGLGALIGSSVSDQGTGDILAIITNITWDLGTTASSSNSMSPDTCARNKGRAAMFIFERYDSVAANLAKGSGTHIATLLQVSGCDAAIWDSATSDLRKELSTLTSQGDYSTLSRYDRADRFFDAYINTLETNYPGKCNLG